MASGSGTFGRGLSPSSCPRIAVRRMASPRSPMSRASMSFLNGASKPVDGRDKCLARGHDGLRFDAGWKTASGGGFGRFRKLFGRRRDDRPAIGGGDGLMHRVLEILIAVIAIPTAALIERKQMVAPPLGERAPLLCDVLQ